MKLLIRIKIAYQDWRQRRMWDTERQLAKLRMVVSEDHRWMAHDPKVSALCERYLAILATDWMARPVVHVNNFREMIGCSPRGKQEYQPGPSLSIAARDVLAERNRQIHELGRDGAHDDEHNDSGDLACAGAAYALNAGSVLNPYSQQGLDGQPEFWPWDAEWWKPKAPREDLVRAGALILAELERMDRAAGLTSPQNPFPQPEPITRR